jgi:hypothetical protein
MANSMFYFMRKQRCTTDSNQNIRHVNPEVHFVNVTQRIVFQSPSSKEWFITVPRPVSSTSPRGDSTVYWSIRLWDVLPSAA